MENRPNREATSQWALDKVAGGRADDLGLDNCSRPLRSRRTRDPSRETRERGRRGDGWEAINYVDTIFDRY